MTDDEHEDEDPIVSSVSSGYADDPFSFSVTRSGRVVWMYPLARQQFETAYERRHGHKPPELIRFWRRGKS